MTLHIPAGLSLAPSSQSCCTTASLTPPSGGDELNTTSISTLDLNKRIVPETKSKSCYSLLGRCFSSMICGYEKAQDAKAKEIFKGFLETTYGNKISEDVIANLKSYASGSYLTLQDLVDADLFVKKDLVETPSEIVVATENTSLIGITIEETNLTSSQDVIIERLGDADIKQEELRQESEFILENTDSEA
ncbi:MAG: hypothetical protein FJZ57_03415 [Chlamydiae bacterium]|nr:hypothetical protein [Chlamydiota bacterium]